MNGRLAVALELLHRAQALIDDELAERETTQLEDAEEAIRGAIEAVKAAA